MVDIGDSTLWRTLPKGGNAAAALNDALAYKLECGMFRINWNLNDSYAGFRKGVCHLFLPENKLC